jgi:hypothetical protein
MTSVPPPGPAAETGARSADSQAARPSGPGDGRAVAGAPKPGPPSGAPAGGSASDAGVRRALDRLEELEGLELSQQVAVFEDLHRSLHDALSQAAGEGASGQRS